MIIFLVIIFIVITIIIMISNIIISVYKKFFSPITRYCIPNAIVATTETILIFTHHFWYTNNKFNLI